MIRHLIWQGEEQDARIMESRTRLGCAMGANAVSAIRGIKSCSSQSVIVRGIQILISRSLTIGQASRSMNSIAAVIVGVNGGVM